jgi:hypothetical protein
MRDAIRKSGSLPAAGDEDACKLKKRASVHCSICTRYVWFNSMQVTEPQDAPEPRLSWTLCKQCHAAVMAEMDASPVRSSLRLRVAMGMVASERWPLAYSTRMRAYISDRRWIVFLAVGFMTAMIVHLILIVIVAGMR